MFEDILIEQNPHWSGHQYETGIKRDAFKKMLSYLSLPQIISITGVRRSGKSTLLKQLINHLQITDKVPASNIFFINLEHPYFVQYASDIKYLEKIYEDYLKVASPQKGLIYLLLDEIQFFQNWPVFIKAHYEQKKIKFIITGSNSEFLSSDLLTLLSGRSLPVEIYPLSFKELALFHNPHLQQPITLSQNRPFLRNLLDTYLSFGGFPEVALLSKKDTAFDTLNAYGRSILYQDVAKRLQLKKASTLEKLFFYALSHIGTLFSYHNLSTLFEISDKTIKDYLKALEETSILFQIDIFAYSLKKQIRQPQKIYSIDPGMVNSIAFHFSEIIGKLLENIVFLELKRQGKRIHYYKTASDFEIDFTTQNGKSIELIQVAKEFSSPATKEREIRSLVQGAHELKLKKGTILTLEETEHLTRESIEIDILPIYQFLLQE